MFKRVIRVTMVLGVLCLVALILSLFLFELPVIRFFVWATVILNSIWIFLWSHGRAEKKRMEQEAIRQEPKKKGSPKKKGKKNR